MTEPSDRKPRRKSLVFGSVAIAAAVGVLLAYFLGAFEERGEIRADGLCHNLPDRQAAADIFTSVLPQARHYDFQERSGRDADWSYTSTCRAVGDDDQILLLLTADMGAAKPWQEWADHEMPPTEGKRSFFNAGIKGISTLDLAAIYVPCYSSEEASKAPHNLTVMAHALESLEGSDKEVRQKLIDLATDFARSAHKEAKCDRPSKLPD